MWVHLHWGFCGTHHSNDIVGFIYIAALGKMIWLVVVPSSGFYVSRTMSTEWRGCWEEFHCQDALLSCGRWSSNNHTCDRTRIQWVSWIRCEVSFAPKIRPSDCERLEEKFSMLHVMAVSTLYHASLCSFSRNRSQSRDRTDHPAQKENDENNEMPRSAPNNLSGKDE